MKYRTGDGGLVLRDELQGAFKRECDDHAKEIDPSQRQDWYSLTLGWAIAKGLNPEDAKGFARYIRYETELG